MLDLKAIRSEITSGLYAKLTVPVIRSDEDGDVPDYPFVTYTMTSPRIDLFGNDIKEQQGDELHRRRTVELVASFTVYSKDEDQAEALCMRLIDHFSREVDDLLVTCSVVSVGDVQNRSFVLADHYERRYGADVRFRALDRHVGPLEWIEHADIVEGS